MPYIGIHVTGTLTDAQKDAISRGLGERISLIPNKTERVLMVDISENHTMYFAGERRPLAFVDVRCYGSAEFDRKKAFTESVFGLLGEILGLGADEIYVCCGEYPVWGTRGSLK